LTVNKYHILECFALTNFLLCSATFGATSQGHGTDVMQEKCAKHFQETLRVLQPTIVVIQTITHGDAIRGAFDSNTPVPGGTGTNSVATYEGGRCVVVSLAHPSSPKYFWGDLSRGPNRQYLWNTVIPALQDARARIVRREL